MSITSRRSRRPLRRFSSGSPGSAAWKNAFAPLGTGNNIVRSRGLKSTPTSPRMAAPYLRPNSSEDSDYEDMHDSRGPRSSHSDIELSSKHSFGALSPARPITYTSLPPTPISVTPTSIPASPRQSPPVSPFSAAFANISFAAPPFSLWDYLREEILATDFDSHHELKWERVSNFLSIPLAMEKIIGFGFILCLDSFLYTFTILPIRATLAFLRLSLNIFIPSSPPLPPAQKADLLRTLLLVITVAVLIPLTDASQIYHFIRGQETIKLYVIFNALEIGDRLCASIGQDILDCLFSRSTLEPLSRRVPLSSSILRPVLYFILAAFYNVTHTIVMIYQLLALNVAVNSYDHALLTLLVSNQFVEIKGSVFKRFEKDNLFQITCADIVERFTLALMLTVVAFRNLIELSGSEFDFAGGFVLPRSFGWFRGNNVLWTISYPVVTVMVSEMVVDWLKHAFITKFNHIRPSVYERYTDVLCRDLSSATTVGRHGARKHTYVDQSPLVARRLGFASLPLAVLAILIGTQSIGLLFQSSSSSPFASETYIRYVQWSAMGLLFWLCFVVVKIILGVNLISYAVRRKEGMDARAAEDAVNDFGRDPIGEGKAEQKYNKELKTLLDNKIDDVLPTAEIGERPPTQKVNDGGGGGGGRKARVPLEDLTRFTMVKRIW